MKKNSPLHSTCAALLLLGIVILPSGLCAQNPEKNSAETPTPTPAPANRYADEHPNIDLDLPEDTTVGQAIALLKKNYPQYNYMLASKTLESVKLREIKVRSANLSLLAQALSIAAKDRIDVSGDENLEILYVDAPPSQPMTVSVFNITPWLGTPPNDDGDETLSQPKNAAVHKKIDELYTMIQRTIELVNSDSDDSNRITFPRLAFLPEGNLLVVKGKARAVEIAGKIIDALPAAQPKPSNFSPDQTPRPEASPAAKTIP